MLLEVQLTVQDFLNAQRLHFRPRPAFRWALYLLAAVVVLLFCAQVPTIVRGQGLSRGWWVLLAGLAYGAFLFFFLLPWRIGRIFRQSPALAATTRTTITEDGLLLDSTRGQLRCGWPMIKRWKSNQEIILVYHSASHFHMFPRRCFVRPEEFGQLRELLLKHLGPAQP